MESRSRRSGYVPQDIEPKWQKVWADRGVLKADDASQKPKFYDLVKSQLQAKTHWQESNDLEMMFSGTYSTEFYRAVRDLLHAQVDADTAAQAMLSERWDSLLAQERRHRNANGLRQRTRAAANEAR